MATRSVLPFVVEDGSGLVNATSLTTVLFADEYMDRIPDAFKPTWIELDEFQKQQLLVWGSQLLNDYIYFPSLDQQYRTIQLNRLQAFYFPHIGFIDRNGWVIDSHTVPDFMQRATVQMAFELSKADRSVEPTRGILSASVGPLSVQFDPNYAHGSRVIPRSVLAIVAPYGGCLRGGSGVYTVPLYRA